MTRTVRIISVTALLLVAIVAWLWLRTTPDTTKSPAGNTSKQGSITVSATLARTEHFSEALMLSGVVLPAEQVDVYPEVSGRVTSIEFTEGARVVAGQVLVRLYDADIRAQLKKLHAQFSLDSTQLVRYESMRKLDGVSMADLDAARAQVQVRKAEIEQTLALLDKTVVKAPFNGTLGLRMISKGAVVTPQTRLTSLADVSSLKVDISVPSRYSSSVHQGSSLQCVVQTHKGSDTVTATVFAEDPSVTQNTRTLRIRARIVGNHDVIPGSVVDVILHTSAIADAMMIPSQAIQQGMNGASVFVVKGGVVQEVPVTLGGRTADRVHVLSGLSAGDTVATNGLLVLKQGMTAHVTLQ